MKVQLRAMREPFEIVEHPADIGFIAYGGTAEELFANAALALLWLTCELPAVQETVSVDVEVTGTDVESLLFAWLAEVLATADATQLVFRRATVGDICDGKVRGTLYGESLDRTRHQMKTGIKAVTMHQLRVAETPDGWRAQVFLDV
ncbi:MAG TPA: archease [Candidatus Dormibacteraeota bacterium]|nr:archease [Candidatus Dormibacteraeota bacterium]